MPGHEAPLIVAKNPLSDLADAQVARRLQVDVTDMITDVTDVIRDQIGDNSAKDATCAPELHTIYPRDLTLYEHDREGRVKGSLNLFFFEQGYNGWVEEDGNQPRRTPEGSASHEWTRRMYMMLKAQVASSLSGGERYWRGLQFDADEDIPGILRFTPVLAVTLETKTEHLIPGGVLAFASFKDREQGHRLARATTATIETLSHIADSEKMDSVLDQIDYTKLNIARRGDDTSDDMKKYAPSRMISEAAVTTAQVTSFLLADLDHVDVKQAVKSLNANGVYKFLSVMLRPGVLGPFATSGYKIRKDFALDQEKLARDEYALSEEFRDVLIKEHAIEMLRAKAIFDSVRDGTHDLSSLATNPLYVATRDSRDNIEFNRGNKILGCPANAKDIAFVANLVADHMQ